MPPHPPITEQNGMLRSCTSGILTHSLDPAIPWVWIRHHSPKRYIPWWNTQAALSEKGLLHEIEVHTMEFDLRLSMARFLESCPSPPSQHAELDPIPPAQRIF